MTKITKTLCDVIGHEKSVLLNGTEPGCSHPIHGISAGSVHGAWVAWTICHKCHRLLGLSWHRFDDLTRGRKFVDISYD